MTASTTNDAPLLEANDLTVRFGKVSALDGLNLIAPPGEVLAILGPNGAGKTTFVRTIATLVAPTSGSLRVRGNDVVRNPLTVRRDIGLAGQYAAVEPTMTGRENLVMTAKLFGHPREAANRAASTVIEQLSLEEVADRRCSTYSGGQRRRLDLGASLVGAPRLLLLDEPTTGLDPAGRSEVWDAVRRLVAAGTDVLLTTHYLDEADELADNVVVIDHGKAGEWREGTSPSRSRRTGRETLASSGPHRSAVGVWEQVPVGEETGWCCRTAASQAPALVGLFRSRLNFCIAHRTRCWSMRNAKEYNSER